MRGSTSRRSDRARHRSRVRREHRAAPVKKLKRTMRSAAWLDLHRRRLGARPSVETARGDHGSSRSQSIAKHWRGRRIARNRLDHVRQQGESPHRSRRGLQEIERQTLEAIARQRTPKGRHHGPQRTAHCRRRRRGVHAPSRHRGGDASFVKLAGTSSSGCTTFFPNTAMINGCDGRRARARTRVRGGTISSRARDPKTAHRLPECARG